MRLISYRFFNFYFFTGENFIEKKKNKKENLRENYVIFKGSICQKLEEKKGVKITRFLYFTLGSVLSLNNF